jgi:hypothetical protein
MLNEWWMIDWLTVHMFWLRESIWLTEFTNTIKSWMKRCSNCQRAPPFLAASSLSLFTFQSKGVVRVSLKNASRKMTDQFAVNTPNLLWYFDESGSPKDDELVVELGRWRWSVVALVWSCSDDMPSLELLRAHPVLSRMFCPVPGLFPFRTRAPSKNGCPDSPLNWSWIYPCIFTVIPLRLVPQGRSTNHEWVFYEDMFSFCCNCIEMFVSWKLASPFPMTMHR